MMKKIVSLSIILLLMIPCFSKVTITNTNTDFDNDRFSKIIKLLNIKEEDCETNNISEYTIPTDSILSIWAIPENKCSGNNHSNTIIYVLLFDKNSSRIINKYEVPIDFGTDMIFINPTPYQLHKKEIIYEVKIKTSNFSRLHPYKGKELLLFTFDNHSFVKIFHSFFGNYNGEWDDNCEGEWTTTNDTLIVANTKTNGFHDINIRLDCSQLNLYNCEYEELTLDTIYEQYKYNGASYEICE